MKLFFVMEKYYDQTRGMASIFKCDVCDRNVLVSAIGDRHIFCKYCKKKHCVDCTNKLTKLTSGGELLCNYDVCDDDECVEKMRSKHNADAKKRFRPIGISKT